MTVMLGAQRGGELDAPIERHVSDRAPETLQDDRRVAPLAGWRGLRVGGRHVSGDEGKDPAEQQLRRPRVEGDQTAWFQDAEHLLDRNLRARREDVCELTEHHVELPVSEGEVLHVSLLPHDVVHRGDRCVLLRDREQLRRQVDARDDGPRAPRGDAHDAGSAPRVEPGLAGSRPRGVHEPCRARSCRLSEWSERLPDLPLARLERLERIGGHRLGPRERFAADNSLVGRVNNWETNGLHDTEDAGHESYRSVKGGGPIRGRPYEGEGSYDN